MRIDYFMYITGALGLIAALAVPQAPGAILIVCSTLILSQPFIASGFKIRGVQDDRLKDLNARLAKLENDVNTLRMIKKMEQQQ